MCTTLGACQNKSEKNIKDGTYSAEVEGYQSSLTVEVTFSNGSITSVEVVDSNETKIVLYITFLNIFMMNSH